MEGTPFGRYRLVELLGRGGMGEVWRAYDTETERTVAIKRLSPHLADDDGFVHRFRREAHAAARLSNPHVIPIHNYGEIDGRLYVDMRLVEGRDLHEVLTAGPLQPDRAVRIIQGVASALHAAHEIGLLHRDVKPSNILLDANDFAYLIDFGIARAADETRLTKSGNMIGTFQYIAPERLGAVAQEDARADIYSLACVLYECLTGHPPFAGDTMAGLVAAHLLNPPPQPSATHPTVPAHLDAVIATGMAKDPDQRYATTVELANAATDAITTPVARPSGSAPPVDSTPLAPPAPYPLQREPTRGNSGRAVLIAATALIVVVAVGVAFYLFTSNDKTGGSAGAPRPGAATDGRADVVRVASSALITQPGTKDPKVVLSLYEDFLCPACGNFEQTFGPTVSNLIDTGAVAADYTMVSILDSARTQNYSSRAGAAALCVADESIDAFRRFHTVLFSPQIQPSESGTTFPDNTQLIEFARMAGVIGTVPDCINSGKYLDLLKKAAAGAHVKAAPTVRINGVDHAFSTPDALVAAVKQVVGNVPGI